MVSSLLWNTEYVFIRCVRWRYKSLRSFLIYGMYLALSFLCLFNEKEIWTENIYFHVKRRMGRHESTSAAVPLLLCRARGVYSGALISEPCPDSSCSMELLGGWKGPQRFWAMVITDPDEQRYNVTLKCRTEFPHFKLFCDSVAWGMNWINTSTANTCNWCCHQESQVLKKHMIKNNIKGSKLNQQTLCIAS